ncbi:hypothetical protein I7I51_06784, partial [Histoplasma capsulatum]
AYMSEKVRASLYAEMDSSFGVAKTKHCVVDAEPPLAPRGIKKPTKRKGTNYPERWSLYHHRLNSLSLLPIRQIASSLRLALCPKPKVVMRPHCRRGLMPQQRGNIQMVRQRGRPMMPQLKKSSMAQPLAVLQPSANEGRLDLRGRQESLASSRSSVAWSQVILVSRGVPTETWTDGSAQPNKHLPRPGVPVACVGDIFHGMGSFRSDNLSYFLCPVHQRHDAGKVISAHCDNECGVLHWTISAWVHRRQTRPLQQHDCRACALHGSDCNLMAPSINSDHRCFLSPPPSFSAIITKALSIVYALIFGFAMCRPALPPKRFWKALHNLLYGRFVWHAHGCSDCGRPYSSDWRTLLGHRHLGSCALYGLFRLLHLEPRACCVGRKL